jgi:uncharacterized protein
VTAVKVVLAGGSGALGRRIARDLADRGHEIVVLSRSAGSTGSTASTGSDGSTGTAGRGRRVLWDGATVGEWADELADAAVVNLCGELVYRRPTAANIARLTRSRTEPTRALAAAAATVDPPVRVWLQMSTLAIYGDAGEAILDETAPPALGPPQMAGVARAWEASLPESVAGRQVVLRTGIVLDRDTPAFDRLVGLVRWGLGGRFGDGQQWVSWLHIDDMLAIVRHCLNDPDIGGVVHATAPHPVRNRELMATLRHALRRPIGVPSPAPLIRLGALLLGTDPALALTGRRCVPARLRQAGFSFAYPELGAAVAALVGPAPTGATRAPTAP